MGFPSVCFCVVLPKPLILVFHLLDLFKLSVSSIIFYLGLRPLHEEHSAYPSLTGELPPSFSVSAPVHPSAIKRSLPIVKFSTLRKSLALLEGDEAICAVCLGTLEEGHEVRELGSCSHAFHRLCIDKWMDMSHQVTCPLCRAQLLPKGREEKWQ